ncbi:MAG: type II toxin-antitoxin system HipA family toxin [Archangium sp.]|nr:type II toxin-antitoxin system HipA family toxin [Archangium sp.]
MTSDACFVAITLPGQTEPVTAARFEWVDGVGRLVYGTRYLARTDAVPLEPALPLSERTFETASLGGLFGSLRDSSPDFWGRRVLERNLGRAPIGEVELLLRSPDDRAGALSFSDTKEPPPPLRRFSRTLDLARLQRVADLVLEDDAEGDSAEREVEELMLVGTSMGGARPKAVVEDEGALWLAKFNRADDRWNMARVEAAMLRLARLCGIETPDSKVLRVGARDALLVRRFDRRETTNGLLRSRMISALTLLEADEDPQGRARWSYLELVERLRKVSAEPARDAHQLFRRVVFNALTSNVDDHPRNHAFIAWDAAWRLSPAYDLTPFPAVSRERRDLALVAGRHGRWANAENLLSEAERFLLSPREASRIVDSLESIVAQRWRTLLRAAGVSVADCERLAPAFGYPGFRLEP